MSARAKGVVIGAFGMLLVLLLTALLVVLTGGYNVAATDRHNPIVGWALDTTMQNHVEGAAEPLIAPRQITPTMIAAGAGGYKAMCAQCHGGVGEGSAGWAETMRPAPPPLARAAQQWSIEEVHWIVRHGIKMSGMPAFGPTHDEETLWNIAAFVKALPDMNAEQYAGYSDGHGEGEAEGGHGHAGGAAHEH